MGDVNICGKLIFHSINVFFALLKYECTQGGDSETKSGRRKKEVRKQSGKVEESQNEIKKRFAGIIFSRFSSFLFDVLGSKPMRIGTIFAHVRMC